MFFGNAPCLSLGQLICLCMAWVYALVNHSLKSSGFCLGLVNAPGFAVTNREAEIFGAESALENICF